MLHALVLLLAPAAPPAVPAHPYTIEYTFRSTEPATHLGDVTVRVTGRDADVTLFQMPKWYPGRYAIYNFAANVQEVAARCGEAPTAAPKRDVTTWVVRCPRARALTFSYRVFWNDMNGSLSQIDSTHINLNPGNTFVYVVGHKPDPVTVHYYGPAGWKVINGNPAPGPDYRFPNYDIMIDNPTEISAAFTVDSFTVDRTTYRVMLHTDQDPGATRGLLVRAIERIVRAEAAMWRQQPMAQYTFMVHYLDRNGGDGMEHTTSTHISQPVSLAAAAADSAAFMGRIEVFAHEFFHTWNMKRLRAAELGPWDYTRENPTRTLWIGEGITNYYGARTLHRAGLVDSAGYLARVARAVTQLQSSPGRKLMSAEQSSFNAWFFDAVPLRQKTNFRNTNISYYNKGELLGWLLDLDIRARTGGRRTLDDVMRVMWQRFWLGRTTSYYLQGHGYSVADFQKAVEDVSGASYAEFFRRYVAGTDELPYDAVLGKVGLRLTSADGKYTLELVPAAAGSALGAAWLAGR
jgi:predicted metalloprotease with PDZ domain